MAITDKYLPDVTAATTLADLDLLYFTGTSIGNYKVSCQNLRKVVNAGLSMSVKTIDYDVLVADCYGKWFSNAGATGTVVFNLPAVASGLLVCFYVETADYVSINPQASDKIVGLGIDGQEVRSNTLYSSMILRATSSDWYIVSQIGTWSAL